MTFLKQSQKLTRERAEELNVSPSLLATRKVLENLIRGHRDLDILQSWKQEIVGNDLLISNVIDDFPQLGSPGDEKPRYLIRQKGNKLAGSTVNYDSSLSTQEIGVTASENYNELKITQWCKLMGKSTFTYHKCKNNHVGTFIGQCFFSHKS